MIEPPHITETTAQPTAFIHLIIPRDQIGAVMGPGLEELMATLADQGVTPAGSWFTHHRRIIPDQWDFEISVPVSAPIGATGRVHPGVMPAMTIARTIYHGDYDNLAAAWGEFDAWLTAHGHTPAADVWERYLVGPETSADPADWRTELMRAVGG